MVLKNQKRDAKEGKKKNDNLTRKIEQSEKCMSDNMKAMLEESRGEF